MKVVIIGGGACGASCATRLRRLDEKAEIRILEKTNEVSIANCGLPYYCSGVIAERDRILVSNAKKFKDNFNIEVCLNTEVTEINRKEKYVVTNNNEKIFFDKLVLTQGANPIKPPLEGINNPNIFTLRNLADADNIKAYIKNNNVKNAVVIGGGFIGIEMAENLAHMGINTKVIEMANQILTPVDSEIAAFAQNELRANKVELFIADGVKGFTDKEVLLNSGNKVPYEIAILAIGVRPEITLAKNCGLETNRGIKVNDNLQTSDENIYAGGDSIEIKNFVDNSVGLIPLAGPANRQGRIIADNICGINSQYKKSQGTSVLKVFDYTVACVGYNEKILQKLGMPYKKVLTFGNSHAGYYPNSTQVFFKLLFNNEGKIFGAQAVGQDGVEKRIDVISSIMRNDGDIQDLLDSELCYAPPFSSAKDPVNVLGMCADNVLRGFIKPAFYEDLKDSYVIDVRPANIFAVKTIEGAVNIPVEELRNRINEVPKDKKVVLLCNTGYTSYVASRILIQNGYDNVYSFMGGIKLYKEIEKNNNYKVSENQPVQPQQAITSAGTPNNVAVNIDACGLQCPGPIMKVAENIAKIKDGEMLKVTSTDKGFYADIEAWCRTTGNSLVNLEKDKQIISATIKKGNKSAASKTDNKNAQTIVVFSGDLDKAMAAFIIANGARAAGKEVTLFFTFWGLNILRKDNVSVKKENVVDKMFGMLMPKGADKLTLSKMNMGGLGSMMMRRVMKNKNVSSLKELIEDAQKSGIKFIACQMSMDVMGLTKEELIDGIEIGGVASYIDASNNANSNLFI
ncbi:MAG: DsrE/DsrF/DrsH-like family protein [Candidatus Riflebacteria bacterium]|nr:DsrE/DsrF/DrsH-like family protein [Candidatus Riflebacteria bacterium]